MERLRSPDLRGTAREREFQETDSRAYLRSKTVQPMGGSLTTDFYHILLIPTRPLPKKTNIPYLNFFAIVIRIFQNQRFFHAPRTLYCGIITLYPFCLFEPLFPAAYFKSRRCR